MKGTRLLNNKEIRRVSACFDGTFVKGGEVSRAVLVNRDSRQAIENVIGWHRDRSGSECRFPTGGHANLRLYVCGLCVKYPGIERGKCD